MASYVYSALGSTRRLLKKTTFWMSASSWQRGRVVDERPPAANEIALEIERFGPAGRRIDVRIHEQARGIEVAEHPSAKIQIRIVRLPFAVLDPFVNDRPAERPWIGVGRVGALHEQTEGPPQRIVECAEVVAAAVPCADRVAGACVERP